MQTYHSFLKNIGFGSESNGPLSSTEPLVLAWDNVSDPNSFQRADTRATGYRIWITSYSQEQPVQLLAEYERVYVSFVN